MDRHHVSADEFRRLSELKRPKTTVGPTISREELQSQVDAYLAAGGHIEQVPFGVMTDIETVTVRQANAMAKDRFGDLQRAQLEQRKRRDWIARTAREQAQA